MVYQKNSESMKVKFLCKLPKNQGFGGGGIRTHDTFSRIHAFQACSIGHSNTPPDFCRRRLQQATLSLLFLFACLKTERAGKMPGVKRLLVFLCIIVAGCSSGPFGPKRPVVLTTIAPYGTFIEKIAGDTVDVHVLVPPGFDPHVFEPTPRQVDKAGRARLWFLSGDPFETRIVTALKQANSSLITVPMSKGIPMICGHDCGEHHDDGGDLHFWLSPKMAEIQARTIANYLIVQFPEHKELYQKNLAAWLETLNFLDREVAILLKPVKGDSIIVSHASFAYFCRDYGLNQIPISSEGKDPLPRDVVDVIAKAETMHPRVVLTQPQYDKKGAQMIAEKLELPLYSIDTYSPAYVDNIRHLAKVIAQP
jgi:zinc transport system substrate-binding protein